MSAGQEWTVTLATGTSLVHDGDLWTVTGLDGGAVTLRGRAGRSLRVHTATLLASPGTRIVGARGDLPAAAGPLLDDLTSAGQEQLAGRLGHVRELLTGYPSGTAGTAAEGEPRPQYDPSLPTGDREAAKAAELGVSARTVRRWVAGYLRAGAAGLVDGRSVHPSDVLAGVDERWLGMCRLVLGEHTEASRPTRNLVLRRVSARLEAEHGPGAVREPGIKKARAVLEELTRCTNTFAGSTKAKQRSSSSSVPTRKVARTCRSCPKLAVSLRSGSPLAGSPMQHGPRSCLTVSHLYRGCKKQFAVPTSYACAPRQKSPQSPTSGSHPALT